MSPSAADRGDLGTEAREWVDRNWDPSLTVGEWWERLGMAGWCAVTLPTEWWGRGGRRQDRVAVLRAIKEAGAVGPPGGMSLVLVAPTIAAHGTDEQKRRFLPDLVSGRRGWCQLFSEPGSGSDLAGLTATAVRDGDEWVLNGQKVWSSDAQFADLGILLARTDLDAPKHKGITYFVIDMNQPGVDVRPLREMTGRAMFNEVFFTDARIPDANRIGELGDGWKVANTTLSFERSAMGGGFTRDMLGPLPGSKAGAIDRMVSEFIGSGPAQDKGFGIEFEVLLRLVRRASLDAHSVTRQALAELYTLEQIVLFNHLRGRALAEGGKEIPGLGNISKLLFARIRKLQRDLGMAVLGPAATLHSYAGESEPLEEATGLPELSQVTEAALYAPSSSILGGTDEIQRNILAEKVLGLPREPGPRADTPFRDIPRNA